LISWTLPQTGPARARIAQARAGAEVALAHFDSTVLNALREAESALTVYARELDRNAALKEARDQSELASTQAGRLYRYGRADFLTTLDAQRTLDSAQSAVAASDALLAADQVALFLALGGGW
jgi:multidrug efflux system outer membrane protein